MVTILDNVLQLLADFGFFRVVLPFLLIFAIFYAVILKSGVLGKLSEHPWVKNIAAIIAFAAAFLVISSTQVVEALNVLIPQTSFLLVVTMLALMLVAFIFPKWEEAVKTPKRWMWIFVIAILLIFLGIIDIATGWKIPIIHELTLAFIGQVPIELSEEMINTLIGLAVVIGIPAIVIAIILWKPAGEEKKEEEKK